MDITEFLFATPCGSFHAGHELHRIQARWAEDDPETGEGSASVDSTGWITVRLDNGRTERRWTHDPTCIAKTLEECGSRVVLRTLSVLGVPFEHGRFVFNVDDKPSSCPIADEDLDEESLEEQLTERGGFTLSWQESAQRGRPQTFTGARPMGRWGSAILRRSWPYDRVRAEVKRVVDAADPIGLLATGAPDDEYDFEVTDLVKLVLGPREITADRVDAVWTRWFGDHDWYGTTADNMAHELSVIRLRRVADEN
ncbi:MAG: hypothetical protein WKF86_04170 [Acidimicrobiales bacterium]